jgi:hypothetical protein
LASVDSRQRGVTGSGTYQKTHKLLNSTIIATIVKP